MQVREMNSNDKAEEELLSFVERQIKQMQNYSNLGTTPGFYELNQALTSYNNIQTSLIGLDVIAKQEAYEAKEAFEDWQAQKYLEVRDALNPASVSKTKWYSSSEIDAYIRVHFYQERKVLSKRVADTEMKVAAIRRLLEAWDGQKLILNRLCKNLEVEAVGFGAKEANLSQE